MFKKLKPFIIFLSVLTILFVIWSDGYQTATDEHNKALNESIKQYNAKIDKLNLEIEKIKEKSNETQNEIIARYEQEKEDADLETLTIIDDLFNDINRLQNNLRTAKQNPETIIVTKPGSCNNERETIELQRKSIEDLIWEAHRADEIVNQLTACQSTVKNYLRTVKEYNEELKRDKTR